MKFFSIVLLIVISANLASGANLCYDLFSQALSEAEYQYVEAWLITQNKLGVSEVLPDHPDKNYGGPTQKELGVPGKELPQVSHVVSYMNLELKKTEVLPNGKFPWNTREEKEIAVRVNGAANILLDPNYFGGQISIEVGDHARHLRGVFASTTNDLYQGHNANLKIITYREHSKTPNINAPIDDFVRKKLYLRGEWWRSTSHFNDAEILATDENPLGSLLYRMLGPNSFRHIFWPYDGDHKAGKVSLNLIRIAVNYHATSMPHSLEVMAKDIYGLWQPFFYERVLNEWFPVVKMINPLKTRENKEVEPKEICKGCHFVGSKYTPKPIFIRDFRGFVREKFQENKIIEELLKEENWR